jgi:hypothetical protein
MFCPKCGTQVFGQYCTSCGTPIPHTSSPPPAVASSDWEAQANYAAIIAHPQVRDLLLRHHQLAVKQASGQDAPALLDALTLITVPAQKLAAVVVPISAALGIRMNRRRAETLLVPPGRLLLRALCAFARRGIPPQTVQQADDGCVLQSSLPSTIFSWPGTLTLSIQAAGPVTNVDAAIRIPGQLFDWGHSRRFLDDLFADLRVDPA